MEDFLLNGASKNEPKKDEAPVEAETSEDGAAKAEPEAAEYAPSEEEKFENVIETENDLLFE